MSRNFISKDEHTAKNSARISGIVLLIFSLVIALVGMWIRFNVTSEEHGESGALMYAVSLLPKALGILLLFGLLSAILSSTDTCLINASTIFVKDILKKESVSLVRITVLAIGGLSGIYFSKILTSIGIPDIVKTTLHLSEWVHLSYSRSHPSDSVKPQKRKCKHMDMIKLTEEIKEGRRLLRGEDVSYFKTCVLEELRKRLHISLCASLGYFPKICTTHTFDDTDTRDSA